MARLQLDARELDRLLQAAQDFQGDAESTINEVLHTEASPLIQDAIRRLMPVSGKTWRGKKPPAKTSKSMTDEKGNLFVTVKSAKDYQYLYFPDDGTNTRRHVGNQQFFKRGGESQQTEIIDRCISKMVEGFENK